MTIPGEHPQPQHVPHTATPPRVPNSTIELRHVSAGVLRDITVNIPPGITAVTGPSGAGKTTLFRLLAKMLLPESGEITYQGRSLSQWDAVELRRQILTLNQQPYLWPGTIDDNLLMPFTLQKTTPPDATTVEEVYSLVGLKYSLHDDAADLSGGEKARVALARNLLAHQDWGLWDEPTAAVDDAATLKIFPGIMDYVNARNLNLLLITHNERLRDLLPGQITVQDGKVVRHD